MALTNEFGIEMRFDQVTQSLQFGNADFQPLGHTFGIANGMIEKRLRRAHAEPPRKSVAVHTREIGDLREGRHQSIIFRRLSPGRVELSRCFPRFRESGWGILGIDAGGAHAAVAFVEDLCSGPGEP